MPTIRSNEIIDLSEKEKRKHPLDLKKFPNFPSDFFNSNALCHKKVRTILKKTKERRGEPKILYPANLTIQSEGHRTTNRQDGEYSRLYTSSEVDWKIYFRSLK